MFVFAIAALIPTIFILWYMKHINPNYNTQSIDLLSTFILGAIMVLPAVVIEVVPIILFPEIDTPVINYLFIVPITEEILKFTVAKNRIKKLKTIDTYNVMLATIYAHAGFATIENIVFLIDNLSWMVVGIRAYMAVPMHIVYGLIMSHFLYKHATTNNNAYLIPAIIFPAILHGIIDLSIKLKIYAIPLCLPLVCIILAIRYVKSRVCDNTEDTQELVLDTQ